MSSQNKPRLSDVAKKSTTDRASKLVSGFLPPPPAASAPTATPDPETVTQSEAAETTVAAAAEPVETPLAEGIPSVQETQPTRSQTNQAPKMPERKKRVQAPTNFVEVVNQPFPAGLRCNKPIMVVSEQHKLLRELSFIHNKPMTEILYNLLEAATQSYQRDQQKDV